MVTADDPDALRVGHSSRSQSLCNVDLDPSPTSSSLDQSYPPPNCSWSLTSQDLDPSPTSSSLDQSYPPPNCSWSLTSQDLDPSPTSSSLDQSYPPPNCSWSLTSQDLDPSPTSSSLDQSYPLLNSSWTFITQDLDISPSSSIFNVSLPPPTSSWSLTTQDLDPSPSSSLNSQVSGQSYHGSQDSSFLYISHDDMFSVYSHTFFSAIDWSNINSAGPSSSSSDEGIAIQSPSPRTSCLDDSLCCNKASTSWYRSISDDQETPNYDLCVSTRQPADLTPVFFFDLPYEHSIAMADPLSPSHSFTSLHVPDEEDVGTIAKDIPQQKSYNSPPTIDWLFLVQDETEQCVGKRKRVEEEGEEVEERLPCKKRRM